MPPLAIEIALWYYCRCEDWNCHSPASDGFIVEMLRNGMLRSPGRDGMRYAPTQKLVEYVETLKRIKP